MDGQEPKNAHEIIWQDDVLDRRGDAEFIRFFLLGRIAEREQRGQSKSYVLNIDAKWGVGKSYFLERFARSLRQDGFMVASVDAWKDDHADDPQLSVMAAIDEAVKPFLKQRKKLEATWRLVKRSGATIAVAAAKGAAKHWSKKLIGDGVDDALEAIELAKNNSTREAAEKELDEAVSSFYDKEANLMLQSFEASKRTIEKFRTELKSFLASIEADGGQVPLFVLVDELDRCRPTYAISLLERVKHLFDIDNVVFVVATDSSQLKHSIKAVYGSDFDSTRYLSRFFDRIYRFDEPSSHAFTQMLLRAAPIDAEKVSLPPNDSLLSFLSGAFGQFPLSLRDIEQCLDIIRSVATVWPFRVRAEFPVLVPLVIAYQQRLPVSLDEHGVSVLRKLAEAPETVPWSVDFSGHIRDASNQVVVRGLALFEKYERRSRSLLREHRDNLDGADAWVERAFRSELNSNLTGYDGHQRGYSVMRIYPRLIAKAGRVTIAK